VKFVSFSRWWCMRWGKKKSWWDENWEKQKILLFWTLFLTIRNLFDLRLCIYILFVVYIIKYHLLVCGSPCINIIDSLTKQNEHLSLSFWIIGTILSHENRQVNFCLVSNDRIIYDAIYIKDRHKTFIKKRGDIELLWVLHFF